MKFDIAYTSIEMHLSWYFYNGLKLLIKLLFNKKKQDNLA